MIFALARYFRYLRRNRAIGVSCVLLVLLISMLGNAICFYVCERGVQEISFVDALWYSVVSVTTIGYGDYYAQTAGGRLGAFVFIVLAGLGSFSVLLGMTIDGIAELSLREQLGMSNVIADRHILIINFPSKSRVRQLIEELKSDPQHENREIVIVTDQIERLPFQIRGVQFVRGPILEPETYERAGIDKARMAIVLATSYGDPNSDAVCASVAAVIDRQHADVHIVAECLNPKHRMLFESVNCDAIVLSMTITGNLLAQEVHDPGISQMIDVITSNVKGTTLYSTVVDAASPCNYRDLARGLLDADVNLICVNRGDESITSFRGVQPQVGDRAIYAAEGRLSWPDLVSKSGAG